MRGKINPVDVFSQVVYVVTDGRDVCFHLISFSVQTEGLVHGVLWLLFHSRKLPYR